MFSEHCLTIIITKVRPGIKQEVVLQYFLVLLFGQKLRFQNFIDADCIDFWHGRTIKMDYTIYQGSLKPTRIISQTHVTSQ